MRHPLGKVICCAKCWRQFVVNGIDKKNLPLVNCVGCEKVLDEIAPDRPKPKPKPVPVTEPTTPSLF